MNQHTLPAGPHMRPKATAGGAFPWATGSRLNGFGKIAEKYDFYQ
jgi:hypothetical protein